MIISQILIYGQEFGLDSKEKGKRVPDFIVPTSRTSNNANEV